MLKVSDHLIDVTVVGTAPLIQHKFIQQSGKPDPNCSDEEIASWVLYKNGGEEVVQPGEHFEAAMVKAGVEYKYKGKKSYKEFIKSGVFVIPEFIPHKNQKWTVDKRRVVIQRSAIMRCRPMFNAWELDFQLEVINPTIDLKILQSILQYAGKYVGVGDQRPKYGRFVVTKWKVRKN